MEKSLVLRSSKANGTSHGGFQWPASGPVECPDWNPRAECGNGLHGLLWGDGDWGLLNSDNDALWQVVEVVTDSIVKIDDKKVKFPRGMVVFSGDMAGAITMVLNHQERFKEIVEEAKKSAKSGDGTISSGDYSKAASSGDYSTAASSGYSSTAASSGDSSTAASSGDSSKAASSGDSSKAASSGDYSKAASSGDSSTAASSGYGTVAMSAGVRCTVQAGEAGCFSTVYFDEKAKRNRILVGYVGEDGIKPDTPYMISVLKSGIAKWKEVK